LLVTYNNRFFVTGSLFKNEICRFFILPEFKRRGYVRRILKELEMHIEKDKYDNFVLDASLGAVKFYQKNNYVYNDYKMIDLPGGNYLCYLEMIKKSSV